MAEYNEMPMPQEGIPEPPKKHKILSFGSSKEQQVPDVTGMTNDINSLGRRVRLVEESCANIRNMLQSTEENIVSKNRTFNTEIKTFTSDINDIRREIRDIKDKIVLLIKEVQTAARKDDVKLLEKYINLWNPVKFVSRGELDFVVTEAVEKAMSESDKMPAKEKDR